MKNPYLFGYLPFISLLLFSLSFGVISVNGIIGLFRRLGVYSGMTEILTDLQLRLFLLILCSLIVFMILAALKLLSETIHEFGMLFFTRGSAEGLIAVPRSGYLLFFFGGVASVAGLTSLVLLTVIFLVSVFFFFMYVLYHLSPKLGFGRTIGLLMFEILMWGVLVSSVLYATLRIYNGLLNSLPFF